MSFRFYTNMVSQASKNVATGILTVGLLLIGFGVLIIVFSDIFALLAAAVFFFVGLGCTVTAVKIYWAQKKFDKRMNDSQPYRENVQVHIENHFEE